MSRCVCVLDYIMHNAYMLVLRDHVHLVYIPRRVHVYTRRDRMMHRCLMYSRDHSRRT